MTENRDRNRLVDGMIDDNMTDMIDKIRRSSSGVSLCEGELIMKLLLLLVAACLRSAFAGPSVNHSCSFYFK